MIHVINLNNNEKDKLNHSGNMLCDEIFTLFLIPIKQTITLMLSPFYFVIIFTLNTKRAPSVTEVSNQCCKSKSHPGTKGNR